MWIRMVPGFFLTFIFMISGLRAQIVVEYYKATGTAARAENGFGLDGSGMSHFRALLSTPKYFGTNGVIRQRVTIRSGIDSFSAQALSGASIFFTGRVRASSYTDAEKAALLTWVRSGGHLILTTDSRDYSLADLFGVTANDSEDTVELNSPLAADHPILNGPFGRVGQFFQVGEPGFYTGIPTNYVSVASNRRGASIVAIPEGALSEGSGRVVLMADTNLFAHPTDDFSQPMSDLLSLNLMAWVARGTVNGNPPPTCFLPRVFAQFANGDGITSTLTLVNASDTNAYSGKLLFSADSGAPLPVNVNGQSPAASIEFTIPPLGSRSFATNGVGALTAGSASLCHASSTVTGTLLFSAPGLGIAGVGVNPAAAGLIIPVTRSVQSGASTGIALVNADDVSTVIMFTLHDQNGAPVPGGTASFPSRDRMAPGAHLAKFIEELLPAADTGEFSGTLVITATPSTLLSAVALRIGNGSMTTLPVAALP